MPDVRDRWTAGSTYEDFMGRWSRRLAPRVVSWLGVPAGRHWLDVGCGTGAMSEAIVAHASPASVVGCDPAEPFIAYARAHANDPRVSFVVAGAGSLPARAGGYGSVTSLLALNFIPDPAAALHEMRSLAAAGGTISACVWDYAGKMEFLRRFWDAVVELDPGASERDEGRRFPLCQPDALTSAFRASGLSDARCEPVEIRTEFSGFHDYWRPLLGGTGPAPSYVAELDPDRRHRLARRLEQSLPTAPDGAITLTARAWVVRGTAS
jgi:SAM-dependent methyltransferase